MRIFRLVFILAELSIAVALTFSAQLHTFTANSSGLTVEEELIRQPVNENARVDADVPPPSVDPRIRPLFQKKLLVEALRRLANESQADPAAVFAKRSKRGTANSTSITITDKDVIIDDETVDFVSPMVIGGAYILLLVPLAIAWTICHNSGLVDRWYTRLLPISLVVTVVGFDIGNQSLSVLMGAPMVITSVHSAALGITTGIYSVGAEYTSLTKADLWPLRRWGFVMIGFAFYQCVNHLVSYYCALSERIVFLNLSPVISLVLETAIMPLDRKPQVSPRGIAALVLMALGAVLFSIEKNDFTPTGFFVASLLVMVLIPYRLVQRWVLTTDCKNFPVGILASLDGIALFIPASLSAGISADDPMLSLHRSTIGSIILLGLVTSVTFIGHHVCGILLMKCGTATSYLVYNNCANFVVIAISFVLFHDNILRQPLMFLGVLLSLASGLWYSVETPSDLSSKLDEFKGSNAAMSLAGSANMLTKARCASWSPGPQ